MTITDRLGRTVDEGDSSASDYAHAGLAIKAAVVCATTANITLSGLQTIDGVTVVADDRVLVKNQTTTSENGIYDASSGVWQRTRDMDGAGEIARGTLVYVIGGTTLGLTQWYVSTANPITIGTTGITFAQVAASAIGSTALLGRITLTSGTILTTSDVVGATSVYWQPQGSSSLTLALDSNSGHTGYQQSGKNFDLFIANDSGTLRLVSGPAWTSDTSRGTGAGTTEIMLLNGIPVNTNSMTARFGTASGNTITVAANAGQLVGTIRMTANGTTEDSYAKRFVSNVYNAEPRPMRVLEATDFWTYSTAAYRQANGAAANQLAFIQTLAGHRARARTQAQVSSSIGSASVASAIGLDSTTVAAVGSAFTIGYCAVASTLETAFAEYLDFPGLGYHYLAWLEYGAGSGTQTWWGDAGAPTVTQSGIWGEVIN